MKFSRISWVGAALFAATTPHQTVYLDLAEARPALAVFRDRLPAEIRPGDDHQLAAAWRKWVRQRDHDIRARLLRGDEDSLVNYLLFGTSFTRAPRFTERDLATPNSQTVSQAMTQRVDDLIDGLAHPGGNERLQELRQLADQRGYRERGPLKKYILENLARAIQEQRGFASALAGDRDEFETRSRLYRERGLSLDTSFPPNYAIEETLKALMRDGTLSKGGLRRAAVIGPGLDFTDKHEGYDYYPQQTLQPFAVIDSLLRLGLSSLPELTVTVFDLSPRLRAHLTVAIQRARQGTGYVIQLPRDGVKTWESGASAYWEHLGGEIGRAVPAIPVPSSIQGLETRAVSVDASVVLALRPVDLNIICEHAAGERFDLIVATNIFVYYDEFEQALALRNVALMLKPGGCCCLIMRCRGRRSWGSGKCAVWMYRIQVSRTMATTSWCFKGT